MHLRMQRAIWLDNIINLQLYILRYTFANSTSLRNVVFIGWQSEYMRFYAAGSHGT